jgi:hypothetical protein
MRYQAEGKFVPRYRLEIGIVLGTGETEYRHVNLEGSEGVDPLPAPAAGAAGPLSMPGIEEELRLVLDDFREAREEGLDELRRN